MASHFRFDRPSAEPITNFSAQLASSVHLGSGTGESHAYALHFEPGGEIGEHVTGFGQLFVVIEGNGWVRSSSDIFHVSVGDVVQLERGEIHAKGSEEGMTAVMIQMSQMNTSDVDSDKIS